MISGESLLIWLAFLCALLPALIFARNMSLYQSPPDAPSSIQTSTTIPRVAILIPARDEEAAIHHCLTAARESEEVMWEILVYDDQSRDRTAEIVQAFSVQEPRIRLISGTPLPPGWCGKQRACAELAQATVADYLLFVDCDVRLHPAAARRLIAFQQQSGAALVSGVPQQQTVTWLEQLLIPLIHFLLLGFLPIWRMRASTQPAYGAGCGQLFLARRSDYELMGGHASIRSSMHDGVALPRAFRSAGLATDLCDATDLATCRMYHSAGEVWRGLLKNASEGLATPGLIVPSTLLLLSGQVLPLVLFIISLMAGWSPLLTGLIAVAVACSYLPRFWAARRFRQPWLAALFHPLSIFLLLIIQWQALLRKLQGRGAAWRGREYASTAPAVRVSRETSTH